MKTYRCILALGTAICIFLVLIVACGDDDDDDDGDDDDDDDDDASGTGDTWTDSSSGLMWQNGDDCCYEWEEAIEYCDNLSLGGHDDWRLPSISELRSLIRGCNDNETGGACGVTDDCLSYNDCRNSACTGCEDVEGPGPAGRYWPENLAGNGWSYWSSSLVADNEDYAWYVGFWNGDVDHYINGGVEFYIDVRCVR